MSASLNVGKVCHSVCEIHKSSVHDGVYAHISFTMIVTEAGDIIVLQ